MGDFLYKIKITMLKCKSLSSYSHPQLTCLPKIPLLSLLLSSPLPELQLYQRHFFFSVSVLSKNKVINLQVVKPAAGVTGPDAVR